MASLVGALEVLAHKLISESFIEKTDKRLMCTNVALSGGEYCGISIFVSILVALGVFLASLFFKFPILPGPLYSILGFFVSFIAFTLVLPLYLIQSRTSEIEDSLPDALRQMSTALRAGVSVDAALEDVADSDYGALSEEFEYTLAQIRRGREVQGALKAMADRSRSDLFERAFFLVVEGMKRGAELADVLENVSEDIREVHAVKRERRSATMQQVLFLLAAALFAGPFIAGLVLSVGEMFAEAGGQTAAGGSMGGMGGMIGGGGALPDVITQVIPIYIILQAAITAVAVGVIRYGDVSKGLMYVVPFVGGAAGVFYGSKLIAGFLFPT